MPSVDVAGLVEALAARAHWPYGVVASVMNEALRCCPISCTQVWRGSRAIPRR